jgi:uncharacterized protein YkwD
MRWRKIRKIKPVTHRRYRKIAKRLAAIKRQKVIVGALALLLLVSAAVVYGLLAHGKVSDPVSANDSQDAGGLIVSGQPSSGSITIGGQSPQLSELLEQINNTRAANGVPAVTENKLLDQSATAKASDMIARNYWAHNAPDGTEPWVFIHQAGYKFQNAGENLWNGHNDTVISDWLQSPTHKAVMLDAHYTEIGIAIQKADNYNGQQNVYLVVTHYGSPYTGSASSYTPTTNTSTSGSGYQYQLPDYTPTPMPNFDYGRSSPSTQSTTQQNCGTNTDSSYYANCIGN